MIIHENNTNMLSRLQGKPLTPPEEAENQCVNWLTFEPQTRLLWFERNRVKDHEDTMKNPTVCNNYGIEIS